MNDGIFDGQILAEKLSKLNSSQQSIESLSRWCLPHRKKARLIVNSWDKAFNIAQREQRVSFLYLANDILQNSRRKGSEFVNEFWKVLPSALKCVYENGDENGKKTACRLVDIWEERKVFGSRGQNLKDEIMGKDPPPSISNGKSSNPIKIVKRDAHSLRIKLAVGGMPEKIVTAFQSAHDENIIEEVALNTCKDAASLLERTDKDVENAFTQGNLQGSELVDEIQVQENVLKQCVGQLENSEVTRAALVSQLKEALHEQEMQLELIRMRLQVARGQIEQMSSMRDKLTSPPFSAHLTATNQPMDATVVVEPNLPSTQPTSATLVQPVISSATLMTSEEENKKAAAAAVAAKLAASTSSAQMLTSVLSSLVAEEAASMSGLKSAGFTSSLPLMFSPEKRPKLEKPMPITDVYNPDMGYTGGYFTSLQQQPMANIPPTTTSMQAISQTNQMQTPFSLPPLPPGNSPNQFMKSSGPMMMGVNPYRYGANSLPPPPPPQPPQPPQQLHSQQQQPQPPHSTNGGYYRPPGIGFYGQSHQPTLPPVPRH